MKLLLSLLLFFTLTVDAHSVLQTLEIKQMGNQRVAVLRFSNPIEVKFSSFALLSEGKRIPLKPARSKDRTEWIHLPLPRIQSQAIIWWDVLSVDGHRQKGLVKVP